MALYVELVWENGRTHETVAESVDVSAVSAMNGNVRIDGEMKTGVKDVHVRDEPRGDQRFGGGVSL